DTSGLSLPNLEITEDDLNAVTQITADSNGPTNATTVTATEQSSGSSCSSSPNKNQNSGSPGKELEVDAHVNSPFTESVADNFDSSSVSTGCAEESSSEDFVCRSRRPKTKRHRSLSSSAVTSRR